MSLLHLDVRCRRVSGHSSSNGRAVRRGAGGPRSEVLICASCRGRQARRWRFTTLVRSQIVPLRVGVVEHARRRGTCRQPHEDGVGEVAVLARRQPAALFPAPLGRPPDPLPISPLTVVARGRWDDLHLDRGRTAFDRHRCDTAHGRVRTMWHQRSRRDARHQPSRREQPRHRAPTLVRRGHP